MIMSRAAFEFFQYFAYIWFCVGALTVGFLSIRDLIRMLHNKTE